MSDFLETPPSSAPSSLDERGFLFQTLMLDSPAAPATTNGSTTSTTRNTLLQEIWESEKKYVHYLGILWSVYYEPMLREEKRIDVLDKDVVHKMIPQEFNTIRNMNTNVLKMLDKRFETIEQDSSVADIFLKMLPFFKNYITYNSSYQSCVELIQKHKKQTAPFNQYLDDCKNNEASGGHDIMSLLLMPVQRYVNNNVLIFFLPRIPRCIQNNAKITIFRCALVQAITGQDRSNTQGFCKYKTSIGTNARTCSPIKY